jgi:DNA mismatch endonuclease (patch repair protein)
VPLLPPAPGASSLAVREKMRRQKRTGTGPEVALRRALHNRGLRYRVTQRVGTARPDIVFTRARIAVFVMGDFWHQCPHHRSLPRSNRDWWRAKLDANVKRDRLQRLALEAEGWHVEWVWECEEPAAAAERVAAVWRLRVRDDQSPRTAEGCESAETTSRLNCLPGSGS